MNSEDIKKLSPAERQKLLAELQSQEAVDRERSRESYVSIRADVVTRIEHKVRAVTEDVKSLAKFVSEEAEAFYKIMAEYGQLRNEDQKSFTIQHDNFRILVKSNKVKRFDERADVAAARLVEFLQEWISQRPNGTEDPMYQLAMILLERNRNGDLEYKSVSKLYELESRFNNEVYSDIMRLFKESNVVEGNAINYYFAEKTKLGVWRKIEPSFNRI